MTEQEDLKLYMIDENTLKRKMHHIFEWLREGNITIASYELNSLYYLLVYAISENECENPQELCKLCLDLKELFFNEQKK